MNKSKKILFEIKNFTLHNRLWATMIVIIFCISIYYLLTPSAATKFEYITVEAKTLKTSVEGSGSIITESQVDLKSTVSGKIKDIYVKSGQKVKQGQAIILIDNTEAYQNVQKANIGLERSKIALEKLKLSKTIDETKSQNISMSAQEDLDNAYIDARTSISSIQSEMSDIHITLKELFNCNTGYISTCNYSQSETKKKYQSEAESSWYKSDKLLQELSRKHRTISINSSNNEIEDMISATREAVISIVDTARYIQDAVVYFRNDEDSENTDAEEAYTVVTTQTSNADSILTDINSLYTNLVDNSRALQEAQLDNNDIRNGSDTLNLRSAELDVEEKQVSLIDAQIELAKYTITAPFTGTIGSIEAVKHDWISSNMTIATLSTDNNIAKISLNEVDVTNIKTDYGVELTFDALPDLTLNGKVSEIDSVGIETSNVVTFKVEVTFNEEDVRVRPGMGVTANIINSVKENVLLVPNGSIKNEDGQNYVEVRNVSTGKNERVNVTLGLSNDTDTEIISGLKIGQEVVIRQIEDTTTSGGLF